MEKAINDLNKLEQKILETKHNISNLTEYAIDYFKNLKKKYGTKKLEKLKLKLLKVLTRQKLLLLIKSYM